MRAFMATAEEGSLSAAARALNSSQPTVGRQVSALEDELGLVLFERVGARLELTPGGLELIEHARAMDTKQIAQVYPEPARFYRPDQLRAGELARIARFP